MNKYDHLSVNELEAMLQEQMAQLRDNVRRLTPSSERDVYETLEREMESLLGGAGIAVCSGRLADAGDPLAELARLIGQTDPFAVQEQKERRDDATYLESCEQDYDDPPRGRLRALIARLQRKNGPS